MSVTAGPCDPVWTSPARRPMTTIAVRAAQDGFAAVLAVPARGSVTHVTFGADLVPPELAWPAAARVRLPWMSHPGVERGLLGPCWGASIGLLGAVQVWFSS